MRTATPFEGDSFGGYAIEESSKCHVRESPFRAEVEQDAM